MIKNYFNINIQVVIKLNYYFNLNLETTKLNHLKI